MKTKFPTETIINIKTSGFFYSKIEKKNLYDLSMQVSSRDVFITTGVIYFIFGIIGKISAVFLTIPYPVLCVNLESLATICMFRKYVMHFCDAC